MNDIAGKIYKLIQKGPIGASALARELGISRQTIHKNLKILVENGKITKQGSGAHVAYVSVSEQLTESRIAESRHFFNTQMFRSYKKKYALILPSQYNKFEKQTTERNFAFMRDISVLYSSKIEGNTLNLNSYLNSKNLRRKNKPKEAKEIDDLGKAYEQAEGLLLTEKNILKLHSIIGRSFISPARRGVYRKEPVGVFSSQGIEYLAIEPTMLTNEMSKFFAEITVLSKEKLSIEEVFFWATWVHLTFVLIHPFSDGNGRVARLLEKWFIAQHLGIKAFFLPTEEWYFKHRVQYYEALKLGVNYWEVDFGQARKFLSLLPQTFFTK